MVFAAGAEAWNRIEISEADRAGICAMYADGVSSHDIADRIGRSRSWVYGRLREWGVSRTKGQSRAVAAAHSRLTIKGADPEMLREWTPESAWIWGLWFSDGWVTQSGSTRQVCICGASGVLEKVRVVSGSNCVVQSGRGCSTLRLGSTPIVNLVKELFGVEPGRKARTMRWPDSVPTELFPQFVRGLWDGDGSWWIQRVRHYSYLYGGYASASPGFVESLRDVLASEAGVRKRPVEQQTHGHIVRYSSRDAVRLGRWMYADSRQDIRCDRKYEVFMSAVK